MTARRGRCLCGQVTFEFEGDINWCGHCHCESCRRNTSSVVATFYAVPRSAYRFTGQLPKSYASSKGVERLFCGNCGSPIAYQADIYSHEIPFLSGHVGKLRGADAAIPRVLPRKATLVGDRG